MFFFWPTLNDRTLSGERKTPTRHNRETALRDLQDRMGEFLATRRPGQRSETAELVRQQRLHVTRELERLRNTA